jgi:hypothetical protein
MKKYTINRITRQFSGKGGDLIFPVEMEDPSAALGPRRRPSRHGVLKLFVNRDHFKTADPGPPKEVILHGKLQTDFDGVLNGHFPELFIWDHVDINSSTDGYFIIPPETFESSLWRDLLQLEDGSETNKVKDMIESLLKEGKSIYGLLMENLFKASETEDEDSEDVWTTGFPAFVSKLFGCIENRRGPHHTYDVSPKPGTPNQIILVLKLFFQLLLIIYVLSGKGMKHCDLHPGNIIVVCEKITEEEQLVGMARNLHWDERAVKVTNEPITFSVDDGIPRYARIAIIDMGEGSSDGEDCKAHRRVSAGVCQGFGCAGWVVAPGGVSPTPGCGAEVARSLIATRTTWTDDLWFWFYMLTQFKEGVFDKYSQSQFETSIGNLPSFLDEMKELLKQAGGRPAEIQIPEQLTIIETIINLYISTFPIFGLTAVEMRQAVSDGGGRRRRRHKKSKNKRKTVRKKRSKRRTRKTRKTRKKKYSK